MGTKTTTAGAEINIIYVALGFGVLFVFYTLLILEIMHRTPAALLTAAVIFLLNIVLKFTSFDELLSGIDIDTILLLMNMMIIVGVLSKTGFFRYVASVILMRFYDRPYMLVFLLAGFTAFVSAFIDNVTTVLLITPIVLDIFSELRIDPRPVLLAIVFASNIGGTATLIGDPPNIIIGSVADLGFMSFIYNLTPIVVIDFLIFILFFKLVNKKWLKEYQVNAKRTVTVLSVNVNTVLMRRTLGVLFFVIVLFFLEDILGYPPAIPAMIGAGLVLLLARNYISYEEILGFIDWSTLVFFIAMFIVVRGVEALGVLGFIGSGILALSSNKLALIVVIVWISALLSAFIDNIPFVMVMVPLIPHLAHAVGVDATPLYWALSLGACLGGNGTIVGASANIVVAGIAERNGYHISFKYFTKNGMMVMLLTVGISTLYLIFRYVLL
ncbi:ArsB/NhaD family transporter [Desulfurococcaceae archaeon MEX13E-LK6-19]|nr:ArsB/NhaD family transporter [Desulfurococcaceae archaeon MEX13E-LK6-19]